MRRVAVDDLETGMVLARSIFNERGDCLLKADVALTDRYVAFLRDRGFSFVLVEDPVTDDVEIEEIVSERVRILATQSVYRVFSAAERALRELQGKTPAEISAGLASGDIGRNAVAGQTYEALCRDIETIIDEVMGKETLAGMASIRSHDSYLFYHSIDVAIASVMIGKKLYFHRDDLTVLARGCILHDIGMIFVDQAILTKAGPPAQHEWDQVQQHPFLGYELLRRSPQTDPLASHVAYQHHERQDGKGYPRGLTGNNRVYRRGFQHESGRILLNAEIAAIANVYDAMSWDRPYRPALPPEKIVEELRTMAGSALNREIVDQFLAILPVFPLGSDVIVRSGKYLNYRGVVVRTNPKQLDRPLIRLVADPQRRQILPIEIDLTRSDVVVVSATSLSGAPIES